MTYHGGKFGFLSERLFDPCKLIIPRARCRQSFCNLTCPRPLPGTWVPFISTTPKPMVNDDYPGVYWKKEKRRMGLRTLKEPSSLYCKHRDLSNNSADLVGRNGEGINHEDTCPQSRNKLLKILTVFELT